MSELNDDGVGTRATNLELTLTSAQQELFKDACDIWCVKRRADRPGPTTRLHMLERIITGRDPLAGLKIHSVGGE